MGCSRDEETRVSSHPGFHPNVKFAGSTIVVKTNQKVWYFFEFVYIFGVPGSNPANLILGWLQGCSQKMRIVENGTAPK